MRSGAPGVAVEDGVGLVVGAQANVTVALGLELLCRGGGF
jgi:hypothetical protein